MPVQNRMIKINRQTGSCFFYKRGTLFLLAHNALHEVRKSLMQDKI